MRAAFFAGVLSLTSACGRVHPLTDGDYLFSVTRVIRDDCELAAQPELLGTGTLVTTGHQVSLTLARPEAQLVGTYRSDLEEMVLDGTIANPQAVVRGRECLLNVISLHLDTVTLDPKNFKGTMAITYDGQPDECVCKFWFDFTAAHR